MHKPTHDTETPRSGRAWVWPLAVVGMLSVSIVVCGITVIAAVGDPSYAVEDDYYQKAVDWDRAREIESDSAKLGWHADATLASGDGTLTVTLTDADGNPVGDAFVRVLVFHHARRGDAKQLVLTSQGDGGYQAMLSRPREGQWQVRITATRGGNLFVRTLEIVSRGELP